MTRLKNLLILISLLFVVSSDATTTIYFIRLADSTYSAKLVGKAGSPSYGETVTGAWLSTMKVHSFLVRRTGYYDLYVDLPGGGVSWIKDTVWSGTYGKLIPGADQSTFFSYLDTTLYRVLSIGLGDTSVSTAKLKNLAVTTAKLANDAVTASKLDSNSVVSESIVNNEVDWNDLSLYVQSLIGTVSPIPDSLLSLFGYRWGYIYSSDSTAIEKDSFGYVFGDPTKDDTLKAQAGFVLYDSSSHRPGAILIPSNTELVLPKSKTYFRKREDANDGIYQHMLAAHYKNNIGIHGGRFDGGAYYHNTNAGMTEHDAAIAIGSSQDVLVDGYNIKNTSGDGISIGTVLWYVEEGLPEAAATTSSKNIILQNGIINTPSYVLKHALGDANQQQIGRNGIAPVEVKKLVIQNQFLYGGNPAVIDFEASNVAMPTEEIIIDNVIIDGLCYGAGNIITSDSLWVEIDRISVGENALADSNIIIASKYDSSQYGQQRTISSNEPTDEDGHTKIYVDSAWDTTPTHETGALYDVAIGRSAGSGILIHGGNSIRQITISNCIIKNVAGYGIRLQQGGSESTTQIRIVNTRIDSCWSDGIEVASAHNVQILGCEITNCGNGVEFALSDHNIVSNCLIHNNRNWGLCIYGIIGNTCYDYTISDNHIYNNSTGTDDGYEAIQVWKGDFINIHGNRLYDDVGMANYAISLDSSRQVNIADNIIHGFSLGSVSYDSYCSFRNGLINWDTEHTGINTVPDNSYSMVIADSGTGSKTGINGGTIYPNTTNAANKIDINGATIQVKGDEVTLQAVKNDTGGYTTTFVTALNSNDIPYSISYGQIQQYESGIDTVLTDSLTQWDDGTRIMMPKDYKMDFYKTFGSIPGSKLISLWGRHDIIVEGGEFAGNADDTTMFYFGEDTVETFLYSEYDAGIFLENCHSMSWKDSYIHGFAGDGIQVDGGYDLVFENIEINNPNLMLNTISPEDTLIGRNAISLGSGSNITGHSDYLRNVKFINCKFTGGSPATVDIEPYTHGVIEDITFEGCSFYGDDNFAGLELYSGLGTTIRNITVSNCYFEDFQYGVYVNADSGSVMENIKFDNCIFNSCYYGIYLSRSADVTFDNCTSSRNDYGVYMVGGAKHNIFNNCDIRYNNLDGAFLIGDVSVQVERIEINGGRIYNNGLLAHENQVGYNGIYMTYANDIIIKDVSFQYNDSLAISFTNCDNVLLENNHSAFNHANDPYITTSNSVIQKGNSWSNEERSNYKQHFVFEQKNYTPGWHRSITLLDTTSADEYTTGLRIGGQTHGNQDVLFRHEASRNQVLFPAYRDTRENTIGAKIVGQNYSAWGEVAATCDTCFHSQNTNLLFYTLGSHASSIDDSELRAIIAANGFGIRAGYYFNFLKSAEDTAYMDIGADGYGFRDNGGTIEFKNDGGDWTNLQPDSVATNIVVIDTALTIPRSDDPVTSDSGRIAIDTDDSFIEFHDGTASRILPALQARTITILQPDSARVRSDPCVLFHFIADAFPHGATIKDIAISTSANASDTHRLVEYSDRAGTAKDTVEAITMSAEQYKEDNGTIDDPDMAADSFLMLDFDNSTDAVSSLEVTITYYVKEGD